MSYANRKRKYEQYSKEEGQPRLSDALKREFEGENTEELAAREEKEKKINEEKLAEDDVINMDEAEQTKILNDHGITNIPKTESKRVKKIMELQNV